MHLKPFRNSNGPHWIFMPGGPGISSFCFTNLLTSLPAHWSLWTLDYAMRPKLADWFADIEAAINDRQEVILVGHSFAGMLLLSMPQLETKFRDKIKAIVLMDSMPRVPVHNEAMASFSEAQLMTVKSAKEKYDRDPSSANLKRLFLAYAPAYFTTNFLTAGKNLLEKCDYFGPALEEGYKSFWSDYERTWVPQTIPTLILHGKEDQVSPIKAFQDDVAFRRANIRFVEIEAAGHFPWVDNWLATVKAISSVVSRK